MINIKPLLNEGKYLWPSLLHVFIFFILASYEDMAKVLNSCLFKEWTNMKMIESLSQSFSFHDEEKTKEILLKSLTEFWNSKCNSNKNLVKAITKATQLAAKTFDVIHSRPVRIIINNNIAEQTRQVQHQQRASVRDNVLDQGYKDAETSLANNTSTVERAEVTEHESSRHTVERIEVAEEHESSRHAVGRTEAPEQLESPVQKKRKTLHKKAFRGLDRKEQLKQLAEF
jgi:hypothetical protein